MMSRMWPDGWRVPLPFNPVTPVPAGPTPDEWATFRELLRKAAEFDKIAKQPDCEDPEKVTWMKRMEDRIAALEKANG
jgi:hypothetical protein